MKPALTAAIVFGLLFDYMMLAHWHPPAHPATVDVIARSPSPLGVETLILRYEPPSVLLVQYTGPQGWFSEKLAAPNQVRAGYVRVSGECVLHGLHGDIKCRFSLEAWDHKSVYHGKLPNNAVEPQEPTRYPVWRLSVVGPDGKLVLQRGMAGEPVRSEANWPDLIQP